MALQTEQLVYGGDMMLFIMSGATQRPIAFSTSAKITASMKTREVTSKDSGIWTEKMGGKMDWNLSTDALYSDELFTGTTAFSTLYEHFKNRSGVTMSFAVKTGTTPNWTVDSSKNAFTGTIFITSLDINSPDGESVTFSLSAEGSGELHYAE